LIVALFVWFVLFACLSSDSIRTRSVCLSVCLFAVIIHSDSSAVIHPFPLPPSLLRVPYRCRSCPSNVWCSTYHSHAVARQPLACCCLHSLLANSTRACCCCCCSCVVLLVLCLVVVWLWWYTRSCC